MLIRAVSLALLAPGAALAGAEYNPDFQGLGFRPSNNRASFGMAISENGVTVVGYSNGQNGRPEAFWWNASMGMFTLGVPTGLLASSYATGVSRDGSVIVGYQMVSVADSEAFRWTAATGRVSLGFLDTAPTRQNSTAWGISQDGNVIVGQSTSATDGRTMAFRWTQATGMVGIGRPANYLTNVAYGTNQDGSIIVGTASNGTGAITRSAFLWSQAGGFEMLGTLAGSAASSESSGRAISADGTTAVGDSTNAAGNTEAFIRTRTSGLAGLGFLSTGANSSSTARAVNADGTTVVGDSLNASNQQEAFRWRASTGMRSVASLLTAGGTNMSGILLQGATGVSGDGTMIVGTMLRGGLNEAYVARVVDGTTPPVTPPVEPPVTPPVEPPVTPPVIGGLTTYGSVLASVGQLHDARQRTMAHLHGFAPTILGDNQAIGAGSEVGLFGSAGSVAGGGHFRWAFGNGFTALGGVSYASERYRNARMDEAVIGAVSLRYVHDFGGSLRPFAQVGVWFAPEAKYRFERSYANGAGIATGSGRTNGSQDYFFGRLGVAAMVMPQTELALSGEIGRQRLSTGAYAEPFSASNPFEASVSEAHDAMNVAKARAQLTHAFTSRIDAGVSMAVVRTWDARTDLAATIPGFGRVAPISRRDPHWIEYGARIGYMITQSVQVDAFVNAVDGPRGLDRRIHYGGALKARF